MEAQQGRALLEQRKASVHFENAQQRINHAVAALKQVAEYLGDNPFQFLETNRHRDGKVAWDETTLKRVLDEAAVIDRKALIEIASDLQRAEKEKAAADEMARRLGVG